MSPPPISQRLKASARKARTFLSSIRHGGPAGPLASFGRKRLTRELVAGKVGLEIGGPSPIFTKLGEVAVYPIAGRVDNVNFATETVWEGTIAEGMSFRYDDRKPPGRQYVCDATDLRGVPPDAYDFLLSSHTLEHTANPIKALGEFRRVLKVGGVLSMVLPHMAGTFDHRRPVTPLAHLIEDHDNQTPESDLTHLGEIVEFHDFGREFGAAQDREALRARGLDNLTNRCLHHHTFDTDAAVRLLDHVGWQLLAVEAILPYHIVLLGRKLADGEKPDNRAFLDPAASYRRSSPFAVDRAVAQRAAETEKRPALEASGLARP